MRYKALQQLRQNYNIHAYVGSNGSGKTLQAVDDAVHALEIGRPVLSTVRLTDGSGPTGPDHPCYVPFTDWSQLLNFSDGEVLMDEVASVASSRESAGMPAEVVVFLQQLRKRKITLRWTAPAWARADKIIREVTQLVTLSSGHLRTARGSSGWRRSRAILSKSYDARDMDDFTVEKGRRVSPVGWAFTFVESIPGRNFYDSEAFVSQLGDVDATGRCTICGGKRQVPRCRCGDRAHAAHGPRARRAQ